MGGRAEAFRRRCGAVSYLALVSAIVSAIVLVSEPVRAEAGAPAGQTAEERGLVDEQPLTGAAVSPIELIPRLELRQSFARLAGGRGVHDTTAEMDIQFQDRMLLRYEGRVRVVEAGGNQTSGFGDTRLQTITIIATDPVYVAAVIAGVVLDTASQPPLGEGKQQVFLGGGAAFKPRLWWLTYLVVQEQFSVAGDATHPDVNQLLARFGNIVFARGFAWYKLDLDTVIDFQGDAGQLFGTLEMGRLLIGRVGLFMRGGTQLLGPRQINVSFEAGVRYLFRLGEGK